MKESLLSLDRIGQENKVSKNKILNKEEEFSEKTKSILKKNGKMTNKNKEKKQMRKINITNFTFISFLLLFSFSFR